MCPRFLHLKEGQKMEKNIRIGDIDKLFRSNGATPIKYRKIFKGSDFFRDLTNLRNIDPEQMSDADVEGVEKIAFAMCEDSNEPGMTFEKWLEQFEIYALLTAVPEIVELITGNIQTQAIAHDSKNAERAES